MAPGDRCPHPAPGHRSQSLFRLELYRDQTGPVTLEVEDDTGAKQETRMLTVVS